jgi:hypothetical protein
VSHAQLVFGGEGFVLPAQHAPQAFNRVGQVHSLPDVGRGGWTRAVQGVVSIKDPAVIVRIGKLHVTNKLQFLHWLGRPVPLNDPADR